ncbi:MAG: site-specific DNA-methyltransferase, partial [Chloroflexi bacterium]|nr:site-specific DNA-methyltransferase [Chloroflexota bacterium]
DWFSHDTMTTWGFSWFMRAVFTEARRVLVPGSHVYCFCDWRQTPNVYAILESSGYRVNHCLVWRKTHFGMGSAWRNQHENIVFASIGKPADMVDKGMGSVLDAAAVPSTTRIHPTEKPIGLLGKIIRAIPAQHIIDPFMGSGTTGLAALRCDRSFTGVEINPDYAEMARKRIAGDAP